MPSWTLSPNTAGRGLHATSIHWGALADAGRAASKREVQEHPRRIGIEAFTTHRRHAHAGTPRRAPAGPSRRQRCNRPPSSSGFLALLAERVGRAAGALPPRLPEHRIALAARPLSHPGVVRTSRLPLTGHLAQDASAAKRHQLPSALSLEHRRHVHARSHESDHLRIVKERERLGGKLP